MSRREPLLRSPPFSGVAARDAAVSLPTDARGDAAAGDRAERLRALGAAILARRVGGTFWARAPHVPARFTVLVVIDEAGDVAHALAAAAEHGADRVLALLPASADAAGLAARGIASEAGEVDPWPLLARADEVWADAASELALLALFARKIVRCPRRGALRPGSDEADAAMIASGDALILDSIGYRDCYSGRAVAAEDAVAQLGFWRDALDANRGIGAGAGIAAWKRREVAAMLWDGGAPLRSHGRANPAVAAAAEAGGAVAVWPSRAPADLGVVAAAAGVPVWTVEDGFVRSVGLGSGLHPPLSIVLDRRGIHFDPTIPSDLEVILSETDFSCDLVARAERLVERIVRAGISKYAVGRGAARRQYPAGRRVVLVPGQVEDDLSVTLGGGAVAGNLDLLRRVRAAEPDAHILFKPHPDVLAGHRAGHVPDAEALAVADAIVRDVPMAALFDEVDAVHVLTSLAGFEALLRGREVVTHGGPFYAGWGLTRDLAGPFVRRGRRLTLAQLVAGAMILYARYLDPVTMLPCPPEILLDRLTLQAVPRPTLLTRLRGLQGRIRGPRRLTRSAA